MVIGGDVIFTDKTSILGGGTGEDTRLEERESSTATKTQPPLRKLQRLRRPPLTCHVWFD